MHGCQKKKMLSDFDKSFMKTPQTSVLSFRGYLKNQSEFKK